MKYVTHYLTQLLIGLSLLFPFLAGAASLTSTVNRNQISTNETLTLIVSIDQQIDSSSLDLSPLQQNFEILSASPQSRSSTSIINGRSERSASTTWTITLVAKQEGTLTIPSFTVNSAKSEPILIKVSNSSQGISNGKPLEVQVKTNAKEVYPNQQFIVEIELSAAGNVRDLNGPQLVVQNADVEAFDQQNFQRVDNGIARQVVVLKYSVFAKQAGRLTIPVMTYTGLQNARRSFFGANGTQVVARSKEITVTVNDIPNASNKPWFPAENVSISSSWSGDSSNLNVGDPITRTITITANGQQASAIPPLEQAALSSGLKSYKDQPQLETLKSTQGFIATRIESEAIVANQAGDYVIPEVTVDWWNTNTKKWQTSTLKEQTLRISGEAVIEGNQDQQGPTANQLDSTDITDSGPSTTNVWRLLTALFAIIILIQFYVIIRRPKTKLAPLKNNVKELSESSMWSALKTALKSDNVNEIRGAVLNWGQTILRNDAPLSLERLARASDSPDLKVCFDALDKHLYSGATKPDLAQLAAALKTFRGKTIKSNGKSKKQDLGLNSLYPS